MSNQTSTTTFRLEDFFSPQMLKILQMEDKFQAKIGGMDKGLNKALNGAEGRFKNFAGKHGAIIEEIGGQVPIIGDSLAMLANPYAAAGAAAVAVGAAYVKAGQMAGQWEEAMAKVNVTAQLTPPELKKVSDEILNIGKRSRIDLMTVPDAFNRIISAGLDVNTSMKALEPTLKAAKAGFTDIETTAAAAVSTMNSAGLSDANRVYDVLFATVNKGSAEFKDIAQYLPKIIPGARNVGLSLEQTAGAFAFLTAAGQSTERSATLLENTFKTLGDPDKVKKFKAIGVSLYDTKGQLMPLVSIADQLHGKLNGLSDLKRAKVLNSLGLDMEAASGFAALSQNVDGLRETINFTTNSQGQLDKAFTNSAQSGDVWIQVLNEGKAMMIQVGQTALPIWNAMGKGVLDLVNWSRKLYNENILVRDIISGVGNVFKFAFNAALIPLKYTWNLLVHIGNAASWLNEKLSIGDTFSKIYTTGRPYLMWIYEMFEKISAIGYKVITLDFKGAINDLKNFKLPDIDSLRTETQKQTASPDKSVMPVISGGDKAKQINQVVKTAGGSAETALTGGGSGSGRNVNVTINKLVEKLEIHMLQPGRDSYRDIERTVTEVLTKAVRDSEIALSTN